ncbi:MAG: hypothetical protein WA978_12015 [Sphingopyxis granuli]|uniref:hypothetical protein n=1 Tax=Sphingopyxis granuli TaxID=267128 RepID=UPI003C7127C2
MIGRRFTMIAYVERNSVTGKDAWNMPLAPNFQPHAPVPCFAWVPKAGVDIVDGQKVATRQDVRMMFALGVELRAGDQIAKITNRKGAVLHRGRLRIEGEVEFKHNHQEVALVRVAG